MIKIEVRSTVVTNVSGTSKNGKPFSIDKQEGWAHFPDQPYPLRIEISLGRNSTAYAPGFYKFDAKSFYVDRFNSLTLGRLELVPMAATAETRKAS